MIVKLYPPADKKRSKAGNRKRAQNSEKAAREREQALDRAMFEPSKPDPDEYEPIDQLPGHGQRAITSRSMRYNFRRNKRLA